MSMVERTGPEKWPWFGLPLVAALRTCDTLSTSGFANDVMFALRGQQQATRKGGSDVWRGLFELVLIQQGHLTWCVHAGVRSTVGFSGGI